MSEEKKTPEENLPAFVKAAPELLPVWDWWVKEGKSTVMMLIVVGLAVAGFYGVRNWRQARDAEACQALTAQNKTAEDLESAVAEYGSTTVGPALRLRLAKTYYDAERYQDALDVYDKLVEQASDNAAFADIAVAGRGHALEGLAKYKEASEAYAACAANTNSYLALDAQLGMARCKALQGDKDGAVKDLDALKAATTDELAKNRIEQVTDAIKHYDPARKPLSQLDAVGMALDAGNKPTGSAPAVVPPPPAPVQAPQPAVVPPPPAPVQAPQPAAKPASAPAAQPAANPAPVPAPAPVKK